jgi:3-oxoacyl-[acyl-carrier-protein] synthase III
VFLNVQKHVKKLPGLLGNPCEVAGFGHTEVGDDPRLQNISQEEFLERFLTDADRAELFGHDAPWTDEEIAVKVAKCHSQTSIRNRVIFSSGVSQSEAPGVIKEINAGTTTELAVIAAKKCLTSAKTKATELDAIICGTNTGPGYPSIADRVKLGLGDSKASHAECHDLTEACTAGAIAVKQGWLMINSGLYNKVLVVLSERASLLAPYRRWTHSNLFGDAASAVLLVKGLEEAFYFFDTHSMPWGDYLGYIGKAEDGSGFYHDGNNVHKFVGRIIAPAIIKTFEQAGIDPADIDHFVPHQPSGKTLDLLYKKLCGLFNFWDGKGQRPDDQCLFHNQVANTGNLSSVSTIWLISKAIQDGTIRYNDNILVSAFGSGMSCCTYAFRNVIGMT